MKPKRRPIKTSGDLVRVFANLFDAIEPESPEEIDQVLREAGYDADAVGARMKAAAEQVTQPNGAASKQLQLIEV